MARFSSKCVPYILLKLMEGQTEVSHRQEIQDQKWLERK